MPMVLTCMLTRLHENGVTYGNVDRSGASATAENEKPGSRGPLPGTKRSLGVNKHRIGTLNENHLSI